MNNYKMVGMIVVLLLVLIIVLQNTESVDTRILFFTISMPRAFLLFITFLVGFIAGGATVLTFSRRENKDSKQNYQER